MTANATANQANSGSRLSRQYRRKWSAIVAHPIDSAPQSNSRMVAPSVLIPDESVEHQADGHQGDAGAEEKQIGAWHDVKVHQQQGVVQGEADEAERAPEQETRFSHPVAPQQQHRADERGQCAKRVD